MLARSFKKNDALNSDNVIEKILNVAEVISGSFSFKLEETEDTSPIVNVSTGVVLPKSVKRNSEIQLRND